MRSTVHMVAALLVAIGTSMPVRAQAQAQAQTPSTAQAPVLPPAASTQEAAALAQGWVLLAEGKFEEASRTARSLSARFPRSVSAFALLIDSEIAVGGATTALGTYESWLGARTHEEPGALRRIARAFLYEWSRQTRDHSFLFSALLALAEDGDEDARAVIAAGGAGNLVQARIGDPKAVDALMARMAAAVGSKVNEIQMLAEMGSPRAAAPLLKLLNDPLPENRAAAAAALGKLDHREGTPALRPLLGDTRRAAVLRWFSTAENTAHSNWIEPQMIPMIPSTFTDVGRALGCGE